MDKLKIGNQMAKVTKTRLFGNYSKDLLKILKKYFGRHFVIF